MQPSSSLPSGDGPAPNPAILPVAPGIQNQENKHDWIWVSHENKSPPYISMNVSPGKGGGCVRFVTVT